MHSGVELIEGLNGKSFHSFLVAIHHRKILK